MIKVFLFVALLFFTGCNDDLKKEVDTLKQENLSLVTENNNFKKEIDELKNGAPRLFAIAKTNFDNKNFSESAKLFNTLIEKHPSSSESVEAKKLIQIAEQEIKRQEEAVKIKKNKEEAEEKERIAKATSKMDKKRDDIEKITWFLHKDLKKEFRTNIQLYFGKPDNNSPYLRMKTTYHSDTWLFIHSMIIVIDDIQYPFKNIKFERDNSSSIWEWNDMLVENNLIYLLKNIANSKKTVIRFEGRQYHKDYTVTEKEKQAIKDVLDAYSALIK